MVKLQGTATRAARELRDLSIRNKDGKEIASSGKTKEKDGEGEHRACGGKILRKGYRQIRSLE